MLKNVACTNEHSIYYDTCHLILYTIGISYGLGASGISNSVSKGKFQHAHVVAKPNKNDIIKNVHILVKDKLMNIHTCTKQCYS